MQKIRLFHQFVLDKYLIYKSCNLIGSKHFDLYLSKIFPNVGFVQQHILNSKNLNLWPNSTIFKVKKFFPKTLAAVKVQRNPMIQFQDTTWTDSSTKGQTDPIS